MRIHEIKSDFKRRAAIISVMPFLFLLFLVWCLCIVRDNLKHAFQCMSIFIDLKYEVREFAGDIKRVWKSSSIKKTSSKGDA